MENMQTIMENFVIGSRGRNEKALSGLYGITPINEPAHMAGTTDNIHVGKIKKLDLKKLQKY